jgi:hypothetical protein
VIAKLVDSLSCDLRALPLRTLGPASRSEFPVQPPTLDGRRCTYPNQRCRPIGLCGHRNRLSMSRNHESWASLKQRAALLTDSSRNTSKLSISELGRINSLNCTII